MPEIGILRIADRKVLKIGDSENNREKGEEK